MGDFWSYDTVRVGTFIALFISFVILLYRGMFKMMVDRKNFYWDRFMNLAWCTVGCIAIGDVIYDDIAGGWRVWLVFLTSLLQLYIVIWRNPYYQREKADDSVRPG